jgi:dTDP-4-dehydrorhamnose reductase
MITNFIFHEELIPIFKKIIKYKGVINIGGPSQSVYNFAKKYKPNVKKIFVKKNNNLMPINSSMNLSKLKKIIK